MTWAICKDAGDLLVLQTGQKYLIEPQTKLTTDTSRPDLMGNWQPCSLEQAQRVKVVKSESGYNIGKYAKPDRFEKIPPPKSQFVPKFVR